MEHHKLVSVLRECPISDYYGSSRDALMMEFTFAQAKKEVMQLIQIWTEMKGMADI